MAETFENWKLLAKGDYEQLQLEKIVRRDLTFASTDEMNVST